MKFLRGPGKEGAARFYTSLVLDELLIDLKSLIAVVSKGFAFLEWDGVLQRE